MTHINFNDINNTHPIYYRNIGDLQIACAFSPYSVDFLLRYLGKPIVVERDDISSNEIWTYNFLEPIKHNNDMGTVLFRVKDNMVVDGGVSLQSIEDMKQYLSDDDFNSRL